MKGRVFELVLRFETLDDFEIEAQPYSLIIERYGEKIIEAYLHVDGHVVVEDYENNSRKILRSLPWFLLSREVLRYFEDSIRTGEEFVEEIRRSAKL